MLKYEMMKVVFINSLLMGLKEVKPNAGSTNLSDVLHSVGTARA
jgi:hypothetical protein